MTNKEKWKARIEYAVKYKDNSSLNKLAESLEVLEILKNKKPHIGTIELINYELYDLSIGGLTEDEFNKIKEWLER